MCLKAMGVVAMVRWQTGGFASGAAWLLRSAIPWRCLRLRESPLVLLERSSLVLGHGCLLL